MKIDIRDNIPEDLAIELVLDVVRKGRVSKGENGKMYYCWATSTIIPNYLKVCRV